jgi:hypothetical protein
MWTELVHELKDFPDAVLSSVDSSGYPFSMRCKPAADEAAQRLRIELPEYANFEAGPAWLLCHKHDEALWHLKSFTVKGRLEQDDRGDWLFYPQKFIAGAGIGGLKAMAKFVQDGRRSTKRYLEKRELSRPAVGWDTIHSIWAEVHRSDQARSV